MPLDGLMLRGVTNELKHSLVGGLIDKVQQPSKDDLIFTIRNNGKNVKLMISCNATSSRIHTTTEIRQNPMTAPMFCMLLRKHLSRAKITEITQLGYERAIKISIETRDELGDLCEKSIIAELMGKNSNLIILNNKSNVIIDCLKHVDFEVSRVREVMPGRTYQLPPTSDHLDIDTAGLDMFKDKITSADKDTNIIFFLISTIQGMSKFTAKNICTALNIDSTAFISSLDDVAVSDIYNFLKSISSALSNISVAGALYKNEEGRFYDFSICIPESNPSMTVPSLNETLDKFFLVKDHANIINNKKHDLYKVIKPHLNRLNKKLAIHLDTIKKSENFDIYRIYGDLINSNLYDIKPGSKSFTTINYYDENMPEIKITMDENRSPSENSQRYFKKYNKLKTAHAMSLQQKELISDEIYYLESIISNLELCTTVEDINSIADELKAGEYITSHSNNKKAKKNNIKPSSPHHYLSSTGIDIYVGKNNLQNDNLTLKFASKSDIWLHTKLTHGSHVIIKLNGNTVDDKTIFEAAMLAAYYSKGRLSSNVAVDYTERKNVKKPSGAKPGMVIYETNKTMYVTPETSEIELLKKLE